MKADIKLRLDEIEAREMDWFSKLLIVDYDHVLDDYSEDRWEQVFFDQMITVVRHRETGEIRGIHNDRRTDDEIRAAGGDLAYL